MLIEPVDAVTGKTANRVVAGDDRTRTRTSNADPGNANPLTCDPIGADSSSSASSIAEQAHSTSLRLKPSEQVSPSSVDASSDGPRVSGSDEVVRRLRGALDGYRRRRAQRAGWVRRFVPTGLAPLDAMLPNGGLPCGAITELYAEDAGYGSMTLALRLATRLAGDLFTDTDTVIAAPGSSAGANQDVDRATSHRAASDRTVPHRIVSDRAASDRAVSNRAASHRIATQPPRTPSSIQAAPTQAIPLSRTPLRTIVWIDTHGDFYPPGAAWLGVPLDRLVVLRVRGEKDAFWAAEQSLRCSSVGAVVAPLDRLDERDSRRLQLAAESTGGVGIVLRSMHRRTKSFAAIQMKLEGRTQAVGREGFGLRDGCFCRITLLAVREGMPQAPCWVNLYHETGTCDLHPLPVDRPIAKTG